VITQRSQGCRGFGSCQSLPRSRNRGRPGGTGSFSATRHLARRVDRDRLCDQASRVGDALRLARRVCRRSELCRHTGWNRGAPRGADIDVRPLLSHVTLPTLVLHCDRDW